MRHTFYTSICLCSLFSLVLFVMCLAGCTGQQSPISFYRKPLMTLDSLIASNPPNFFKFSLDGRFMLFILSN